MKALLIAAALAGMTGATAAAEAPRAAPETYTVIEPNARVAFSRQSLQGFQIGEDGSLLIEAVGNRWYRATLDPPCQRDVRFHEAIALDDRPIGTFDRFSSVFVGHNRCMIERLDRIEPPRAYRRHEHSGS